MKQETFTVGELISELSKLDKDVKIVMPHWNEIRKIDRLIGNCSKNLWRVTYMLKS